MDAAAIRKEVAKWPLPLQEELMLEIMGRLQGDDPDNLPEIPTDLMAELDRQMAELDAKPKA